jgi:hypothetical protein
VSRLARSAGRTAAATVLALVGLAAALVIGTLGALAIAQALASAL